MMLMQAYRPFIILAILAVLVVIGLPQLAYAGPPPPPATPPPLDLNTCAPAFQPWEYTSKVIFCMETTIMNVVALALNAISIYMAPTLGAVVTFALVAYGLKVAMGERQLDKQGISFLIRMGLVALFAFNLGGISPNIFAVENQIISMVSNGSPWVKIDQLLGKLMGFGPSLVLMQGLIGIVGAALFSSTAGILVFGAGFMAMIGVLRFIFDLIYTYVAALILIGFLLILSPLVVPLGLFLMAERYFKRWLDILLAVMLTPILIFAFLSMFLAIFSPLIADIFKILGSPCPNPFDLLTCPLPDFSGFWKMEVPTYSWTMPNDPNMGKDLVDVAAMDPDGSSPVRPPVQPFLNPWLKTATNASLFNPPGIDFGSGNVEIMQKLTFAFLTLWIFSMLMRSMLNSIPAMASSIAGVAVSLPFQSVPAEKRLQEAKGNLIVGAGGMLGGLALGHGRKAAAKAMGGGDKSKSFMNDMKDSIVNFDIQGTLGEVAKSFGKKG